MTDKELIRRALLGSREAQQEGLICDCDECWNMPVEDDKQ